LNIRSLNTFNYNADSYRFGYILSTTPLVVLLMTPFTTPLIVIFIVSATTLLMILYLCILILLLSIVGSSLFEGSKYDQVL
jgi:hypothetical protein